MKIIEPPSEEVRCKNCNALLRVFEEDVLGSQYEGYYIVCAGCNKQIWKDTGIVVREY